MIPQALAQAADEVYTTTTSTESGLSEFFSAVLTSIPYWIAGFIVFLSAIFLASMARRATIAAIVKARGDTITEGSIILIGRTIYFGIITLGLLIALSLVGAEFGWLLGAMGIGIGFSLKDLINNFVSGVILLIDNEIKIGDFVYIGETVKGTVVDIRTRYTVIRTIEGTRATIPNGDMTSQKIICLTANPTRRIEFEVGISFGSDFDKAKALIEDLLINHPLILNKPPPYVIANKFDESAIILSARFWVPSVKSKWIHTKSELIKQINETFRENGIEIPFPIRTVQMEEPTELTGHDKPAPKKHPSIKESEEDE